MLWVWRSCAGGSRDDRHSAAAAAPAAAHQQLVQLFTDWRAFNPARDAGGVPDYGAAAMARKAAALAGHEGSGSRRSTAADWTASLSKATIGLVEAEMNALDFYFRVLKPWARDPGFYLTVFPDMSDVPAHEGTYAEPVTDLFKYRWPLNRADEAKLAAQLETVAPVARAGADQPRRQHGARSVDLWRAGLPRSGRRAGEAGAGTLVLRDLDGYRKVSLEGASPRLRKAVAGARVAIARLRRLGQGRSAQAQRPVGRGKDNYDWWLKHVHAQPLQL